MNIKQILMRRDNLSEDEADTLIAEATEAVQDYLEVDDMESAYNVCEEYFSLEPDYIMELI